MGTVRETTLDHIRRVNMYLLSAAKIIMDRAVHHDASKITDAVEVEGFEMLGNDFRKLPYGSKEYYEHIKKPEIQKSIQHHHNLNRHHVEFHTNGIMDMNAFDIIEMVCDWRAAFDRNVEPGKKFEEHLEINFQRFSIPEDYQKMILNTVKWLELHY